MPTWLNKCSTFHIICFIPNINMCIKYIKNNTHISICIRKWWYDVCGKMKIQYKINIMQFRFLLQCKSRATRSNGNHKVTLHFHCHCGACHRHLSANNISTIKPWAWSFDWTAKPSVRLALWLSNSTKLQRSWALLWWLHAATAKRWKMRRVRWCMGCATTAPEWVRWPLGPWCCCAQI